MNRALRAGAILLTVTVAHAAYAGTASEAPGSSVAESASKAKPDPWNNRPWLLSLHLPPEPWPAPWRSKSNGSSVSIG